MYNSKLVWKDININLQSGVLGISGENGSGKSTLLKCLAQLEPLNEGEIIWAENGSVFEQKKAKKLMSYVAPYINLYEELTVEENLIFIQKLRLKKVENDLIQEFIKKFQIEGFQNRIFGSLSTGQQQRVKFASAFISRAEIIFLDEPGSNLDLKGYEVLFETIDTQKKMDKLIIIASNEKKEIDICDQVLKLN